MIRISDEVSAALEAGRPVVALESTVLAHGLPAPRNLEVGYALEAEVRAEGGVPATIAVLGGVAHVGLTEREIARVCTGRGFDKLSTRDLAAAMARGRDGATTVASTMFLAGRSGIKVFATGGIGGVHRGGGSDISADLTELGRTRLLVVCAGAKSILDLPATRESLETRGVLLVGWRTAELPAFYSVRSGLAVDVRIEDETDVASIWRVGEELSSPGAILLCVPPPEAAAMPAHQVDAYLTDALRAAEAAGVTGPDLTPFLLTELSRLSGGRTLETNVALLLNNARVAARVARAMVER